VPQSYDKTLTWFGESARDGAVVPIYVEHLGEERIELDSIDILASNRIHLNKFGWFSKPASTLKLALNKQATRVKMPLLNLKFPMNCHLVRIHQRHC
jgi:hypothetical protein